MNGKTIEQRKEGKKEGKKEGTKGVRGEGGRNEDICYTTWVLLGSEYMFSQ
jgi:hypothetical protein